MLQRMFRYLKGYLRIRVSGNAIERFINACSYKGISTWEITSENKYYELNIGIKDFKKLKPVIRKTRTKVIIVERTGFPFFIKKYRNRKLFFVGFIAFILTIHYLSTYIWSIDIIGNYTYSTESILTFLESIDIKRGVKSQHINCTEISGKIREKYDDIIWVSTSVNGTMLKVLIKENEDSKNIDINTDIHTPYDIVSDGDYQITRMIVRSGIANKKENEFVKQGDILVSGQIPVYNDAKEIINYQYAFSDADIYGKTDITYEDIIGKTTYDKKFSDIQKHQYFLSIGKYRFNLGTIENNYNHYEEYSKEYNIGKISVGIRSVYPYEKINRTYTMNEIRELLSKNFTYYCQELKKKGVVILKNNVKIYTWSDKAKAAGTITVEMPVGHKVKSEIIKTGDTIDGNDGNNN